MEHVSSIVLLDWVMSLLRNDSRNSQQLKGVLLTFMNTHINQEGLVPLLACQKDHSAMAKWLIQGGASVLAVARGKTPWEIPIACESGANLQNQC